MSFLLVPLFPSVLEFHREERNLEDAFIDILGKLEAGAEEAVKG